MKISQIKKKSADTFWYLLIAEILISTSVILYLMGRTPICTCGYISFWHNNIWDAGNSQHLFDWYTFSHIIHGFIFYWFLQKFFPKMSLAKRLAIATFVEVSWEVLENTDMVINRYREGTIALDYYGDSIINSVMDSVAAVIGFWLAFKLPVKVSVALVLLMELIVGYIIHDNLTLNVIMLVRPFPIIKDWQMSIKP